MVLKLVQWVNLISIQQKSHMVTIKTKLSFDVSLELKRVRETARIISKVLRVSKETILTRLRKQA